ncbi:AAEL000745-PA [Aedes aegypti]|uniref:AAEL000745-PA n=1 Tax=Aedes aegypti TaxID=7159 RepID=Q17NE3_AEDAE|nr:AAEL000745-PA [Aedes aegypti]
MSVANLVLPLNCPELYPFPTQFDYTHVFLVLLSFLASCKIPPHINTRARPPSLSTACSLFGFRMKQTR